MVIIVSGHKSYDEAVEAMFDIMKKESKEILEKEVEELRKQGIEVVTFEEAIKDMTPEELERFLEERKRKFIMPMIDKNIEDIKQKSNRTKIKRIKKI